MPPAGTYKISAILAIWPGSDKHIFAVLLAHFWDKLERVKCFQQRFKIVEIVHRIYESLGHGIVVLLKARAFMRCDEPFFAAEHSLAPSNFVL